ncbi:uncharacterized protein CANTADRAFT_44250 [Suhomyces tanzawaensis NRRL Y-17324]|uniref:Uncharacterized protein n=1 Tax=Suhomyces tanzawaensis NRRL Y-17324 TaxID=984487 RepID=A0A1E4SR69_9ASCO|nr:uncharacterized protein CANTADRAFT_44250 [Suhomyces tanzawaensis NRRL Y-17324]ODV81995.1 hypothetical protein CANTADRAFT_44250 [Suhomyces tanzawaensis NRRL Y-17324]
MGLFAKWNALPVKARYYIGGSTFLFALIGDYVTSRVNDEVVARKEVMAKLNENEHDNTQN